MTPSEILRDLRDIHQPEPIAAAGVGFDYWPVILVIIAALFVGWIAWRRHSAWRREIVQHLNAIEALSSQGQFHESWTKLAILLRRIAIRLCSRKDVAGLIGDAWLKRLDRLFDTDIFLEGPGRGVSIFPYAPTGEDNEKNEGHEDKCSLSARQLKATIDTIRAHLPRLKAAD